MDSLLAAIRAAAAEELSRGLPLLSLRQYPWGVGPYLFRDSEELGELRIEPLYPVGKALLSLVRARALPVAVVARPCEVRQLVEMAKRQQVQPADVRILTFSCDSAQAQVCRCEEPGTTSLGWPELVVIGEESAQPAAAAIALPEDPAERRRFWAAQFAKCIKCYGCRNVCPMCFCEHCELEDPLWVERGKLLPGLPMFHLIRAMHMSARCTACRQCEAACPAHIPLTALYDALRQEVGSLLGYRPGASLAQRPPLSLSLREAPMQTGRH
jgi:formate dehydrogenase subunit beta